MATVVTRLRLERPLEELATVFDLAGVAFRVLRDQEGGAAVVSAEPEIAIRMEPSAGPDYHLELVGADDRRLESVGRGLALALQADGVDFRMHLMDDTGAFVRDLEPCSGADGGDR